MAMILITSCSTNQKLNITDTEKAFMSLSTGRSNSTRPVYDLWVFEDGKVLFNGIENVEKNGIHEIAVPLETVDLIVELVEEADMEDAGRPRGRDLPITIIRYNNKNIAFQESRIKGNLLILNNLLKRLKDKI